MNKQQTASLLIEMMENVWFQFHQVEKRFIPFELNKQQEILLSYIIRNRLKSPSFFAERMGISKSAVSQLINKLESRRFVKRVQLTDDKRSTALDLDELGLRYEEAYDRFYNRFMDKCGPLFTEEELYHTLQFFKTTQSVLTELMESSD
ncbi:MarR family transcriptional regulator [Paenibacillus ginsengarvi]|uniref:MarR family transcriptional regulator n=1 Tax=Paenibacillus ginsengarvi TaxID=400777 RepID=A0A3B0BE31_9BACL|nr:MarR family transcriptional regulator [Paenibacillus ginsengarvi]RKN70689.1 MarR family transcriptional regulator [Paenibacillus ginsengarvi]